MKQISGTHSAPTNIIIRYRETLLPTLRSPAAWLFAGLYIVAAIVFMLTGGDVLGLLKILGFLLFYIVVTLLVIPLTASAPTPAWEETATYSRQMLWWQLVALLLFVLLEIGYTFLLFGPLQTLTRYGMLFNYGNIIMTFLLLVILPLLVMRLLRVPWSEMGFGRGYRVWVVIGVSCLLPICVLLIQAFIGQGLLYVFLRCVRYLLVAGFPEEVFFRGLLLTRFIRLTGTKWGIVLSALLFGLVHMALNLSSGGSIALVLAEAMLTQATLGIAVAIIFVRTGNVWAGVVFHTLLDATGL